MTSTFPSVSVRDSNSQYVSSPLSNYLPFVTEICVFIHIFDILCFMKPIMLTIIPLKISFLHIWEIMGGSDLKSILQLTVLEGTG